jgi:hypothetical protein
MKDKYFHVFLGISSHPRTVNNMQEKMSQSFDKDVLSWKQELLNFHAEKRFISEVIESQHQTSEDSMELCTINLNKEAVRNCKSYTEDIYNKCISKLPACDTNIYDEEEVLGTLSSNSCHAKRYR